MQVIAGKARRLKLAAPAGLDTRPTSDRYKETLFNILQPLIPGCRFLDLFAGSGAIGIEALSRGAKEAVFVDNSSKAVRCIRENLEHTHLSDQASVYASDVFTVIRRLALNAEPFDIIFLDPPYDAGCEPKALEMLAASGLVSADTLIVVEAKNETAFPYLDSLGLLMTREKVYKTNKHVFIRRKEEEHDEQKEN